MITDYLNQTVTYNPRLPDNDLYGENTYGTSLTIKARKRKVTNTSILVHEISINPQYVFHTNYPVVVGGKLDGMVIQDVSELVNYAGIVIGVVAYT